MKPLMVLTGILCLGLAAYAGDDNSGKGKQDDAKDGEQIQKEIFDTIGSARVQTGARTSGIVYHGGAVMTGTVNVYLIWYGSWTTSSPAVPILESLAKNIGASPYFNINTTYSVTGQTITGAVQFVKSVFIPVTASLGGTALSDANVQGIVSNAISTGLVPKDSNGVYFVLTSQEINETSGFCTQYCGWHTRGTIGGSDIKYSFVGNAARCPSACSAQSAKSPNGDIGGDAMASILSHELEEAVTDPDLNAWFDRTGQENADKCAWTFGSTSVAGNGSVYNVTLGATPNQRQYLIQQNWVNSGAGFCAMHQ